jgi:hypothetical protein
MKAVILARVSTEEQKEAGSSLPAQIDRLESYCKRKGFQIIQSYSFDESAYGTKRDEFDKILDLIGKSKEKLAICFDKVDRLSRNIFDKRVPILYEKAVAMRDAESARLRALRDETVANLKKEIPSIIFYGAFDKVRQSDSQTVGHQMSTNEEMRRLPNNINCRVPGISSEEMILRLDAKGFAVSHKSACASMETEGSYVVMALGATEQEAQENIRVSMGRTTTKADLLKLVDVIKEIVEKYRKS